MKKRLVLSHPLEDPLRVVKASHVLIPFRPLDGLINKLSHISVETCGLVGLVGYLLNPTLYSSLQLTFSSSPCVYSLWATIILLPSSLDTYLSYPLPTYLPLVASPTQLHVSPR
jgi:hypothetical protein